MDLGVIENFKVRYLRRDIERLLVDVRTAGSTANLRVPLVKAIFFASETWRDVKPQIILNCFKKTGFSWSSSTGLTSTRAGRTAVDVAAAADGANTAIPLEQLWESSSRLDPVPFGLDHIYFVFAADYLVAIENLCIDKLTESVFEGATTERASHTDCDNGACPVETATSTAAIAAVDTLCYVLWQFGAQQKLWFAVKRCGGGNP